MTITSSIKPRHSFFDRDKSWLLFNRRVLDEAAKSTVPLMERLKFLSIFSSNLDEFYRVRMPSLLALDRIRTKGTESLKTHPAVLETVNDMILSQQEQFGKILSSDIIPALARHKITLLFNQPLPDFVENYAIDYFLNEVAGLIHVVELTNHLDFFPENNKLYFLVNVRSLTQKERHFIINIPSDRLPRFSSIPGDDGPVIVFLDDIIRANLSNIFGDHEEISAYSFKVTRDAELDLQDEFEGNLAAKIEREISRRDFGLATRFLYQSCIPQKAFELLQERLGLKKATNVGGGVYHNLKDLSSLPINDSVFFYERWPSIKYPIERHDRLLFDHIRRKEILLHPPFHAYDTVLRFFNESAIDTSVSRIYVTLYRIASDSRIASALITAAHNGKKVTVFVELKARFDEANNIKWARMMKHAGVKIIFSIPDLKVHAKIALVKRKKDNKSEYFGLFATGNFNESTAKYYTDHVLMTADIGILKEAEQLFQFLRKRKKPGSSDLIKFKHLLVAQFNLQERFLQMIDREIAFAKKGLPASIIIKMNNLEDRVLISKLYEASAAGVKISMIVRSICCLIPGVKGMSENITVIRIIDRYLEHGRIFVFNNNGDHELYLGSADWMNRNIYRRIEVCFPIYDRGMKEELLAVLNYQLRDTVQAVRIDRNGENIPISPEAGNIQSQKSISELLASGEVNSSHLILQRSIQSSMPKKY